MTSSDPDRDALLRESPRSDGKRKRKIRNGKTSKAPVESQLSAIERLLRVPVAAVKNGKSEKMSTVQAIVYQLVQRSLAGDKKAERTRQKYEEFARRNSTAELEVVFVDNEYTRAFAATGESDDV